MKIAILCANERSIYHEIPTVEVYDRRRNARIFTGSQPVIAHPPCRSYSAFMSHWAKPEPGERDLALFCTERVACNGGVLEHPAHSRYLRRFVGSSEWKIEEVHQSWFGYPTTKRTWLLMPSTYTVPEVPFTLTQYGKERQLFENMSHSQRSATTYTFAKWLINLVTLNETA